MGEGAPYSCYNFSFEEPPTDPSVERSQKAKYDQVWKVQVDEVPGLYPVLLAVANQL